jgi:hypothetical protein
MPQSRIYNPSVAGGGGGGGIDPIAREFVVESFSYNNPSPKTIVTLPVGTRILTCQIIITQVFNGPGSSLKVGDASVDNRFMTVDQNYPDELAEFEANMFYELPASTAIILTINPAGSTQGQGRVVIEYKQV